MPDWEKLRKSFPVTKEYVYLNHARTSPLPTPVVGAMNQFLTDRTENGIVNFDKWVPVISGTRRKIAELIHADPEEIAFVKNTTQGLSLVANGLAWRRGDNVVVPRGEFPTNVYPWMNLSRFGVETRFVEQTDGRIVVEEVEKAIDKRTRVLAISSVEFDSGFRNHLPRLGEICRSKGVLFVVDGIQSVGVLDMDVKSLQIDILSTASHKWLLGPMGIGFFFCDRSVLDKIIPSNVGWYSVTKRDFFNYELVLHPNARRFEDGHLNMAGIWGLKAAVELLLDIGISRIQERVIYLTEQLVQGLQDRGCSVLSSMHPDERSGIVLAIGFKPSAQEVFTRLSREKIVVTRYGEKLRFSPHFYNTEGEIQKVIDLIS